MLHGLVPIWLRSRTKYFLACSAGRISKVESGLNVYLFLLHMKCITTEWHNIENQASDTRKKYKFFIDMQSFRITNFLF